MSDSGEGRRDSTRRHVPEHLTAVRDLTSINLGVEMISYDQFISVESWFYRERPNEYPNVNNVTLL